MLDSHQLQNYLLQSKSRINREENQLTLQQLQEQSQLGKQKRTSKSIEHYKNIHLSKLNQSIIVDNLKQHITFPAAIFDYLCNDYLSQRLLNYDFPTSDPQIFSTQYLIHKLIDSSTLQIKFNQGLELYQILDQLKEEFTKNPPQLDALIEELDINQQEGSFHQSLENIISADLRSLFPGVPPNQYKELVEGEKLGEYVVKLEDSKKVAQILVGRSQLNQILGTQILEIQKENERMKQQIQQKSEKFIDLINNANNAHMQCETIKKIHDDKELIRVLDQKIQNSENKSADLYENAHEDQVDPKQFSKNIKEFQEIRKQFQLSRIKKKHFVAQLQIQVKKN